MPRACPHPTSAAVAGDCHLRLMQAATAAFVAEGYGVSVDRIATLAGVAKQTLYNHFPGKADLFAEVIRQSTAEFMVALGEDHEALRARLTRFAVRYRERLLSPTGLGLYRMLVAEAPRFPDLAATFYEAGPRHTAARLRELLQDAMKRGDLRRDDPEFAVSMLLSMLTGDERSCRLFSTARISPPHPDEATRIVESFLRAFAP
jgi:TetR/AcrR family transcriptional repressor of mexJK operon